MRVETLLSPGLLSNGLRIRTEIAKAISAAEIISGRTPGGKSATAKTLQAFLTDAASKLSTLVDSTAPTVVTRAATSATVITVTFTEALDSTVVPPKSSVAVTGKTVTSIAVTGSTLVITCSGGGLAAGNTVTYTQPAVSFLRDKAGNGVATFTGVTA